MSRPLTDGRLVELVDLCSDLTYEPGADLRRALEARRIALLHCIRRDVRPGELRPRWVERVRRGPVAAFNVRQEKE